MFNIRKYLHLHARPIVEQVMEHYCLIQFLVQNVQHIWIHPHLPEQIFDYYLVQGVAQRHTHN